MARPITPSHTLKPTCNKSLLRVCENCKKTYPSKTVGKSDNIKTDVFLLSYMSDVLCEACILNVVSYSRRLSNNITSTQIQKQIDTKQEHTNIINNNKQQQTHAHTKRNKTLNNTTDNLLQIETDLLKLSLYNNPINKTNKTHPNSRLAVAEVVANQNQIADQPSQTPNETKIKQTQLEPSENTQDTQYKDNEIQKTQQTKNKVNSQTSEKHNTSDKTYSMLNLSKHKLDNNTLDLLERGLSFIIKAFYYKTKKRHPCGNTL